MRLGTTSYIYPADIVANVRKLAGKVKDIELVLFEGNPENLPDRKICEELNLSAAANDLTYTVHLPLDMRLLGPTPDYASACRVINSVRDLNPEAYIIHLDGGEDGLSLEQTIVRARTSLQVIFDEIGNWKKICLENLEAHERSIFRLVTSEFKTSVCLDLGHSLKIGWDPVELIREYSSTTRVVHLHGVLGNRDHKSLCVIPELQLDMIVSALMEKFRGVLTLEVFNENDLFSSMDAFDASLKRLGLCAVRGAFGFHDKDPDES